MTFTMSVPCLFGLEGLAADELRYLGCHNVAAETGRVLFTGSEADLARANLQLRTGERVQILLGEFTAASFDALFEGTRALPWEQFLGRDAAFPVKGHTLDSKLHSVPDCQRIIKKAVAVRLSGKYGLSRLPETGPLCQIRFTILKDRASLYLDTSGPALHKRGYRPNANLAPLRETLAAAMVKLARYKGRELLIDPFCGSGTIAIEAALAAKNRAPGLGRHFAAERWPVFSPASWRRAREDARAQEYHGAYEILASDIDPACVEVAQENARRAGVADCIRFSIADALQLAAPVRPAILTTNPPYGERLLDAQAAERLYRAMGKAWRGFSACRQYILCASPEFEAQYGRRADRRRKVYNGMIPCQIYMYLR